MTHYYPLCIRKIISIKISKYDKTCIILELDRRWFATEIWHLFEQANIDGGRQVYMYMWYVFACKEF